jgi:ligand-binding sensor domain-containing protein
LRRRRCLAARSVAAGARLRLSPTISAELSGALNFVETMMVADNRRSGWCACGLGALALVFPSAAHAERLAIKAYTTADGLPSTFVQHIVQDSRGFLWFSTRDGLSRFDGYRFVTYGTSDGLPVPTINFLVERRDGTHWVATNGGGVCHFNPSATLNPPDPKSSTPQRFGVSAAARIVQNDALFTCYALGDHPASNRVNHLYEDRAGTLWAGTDAGLFRLEIRDGKYTFQGVPVRVEGLDGRSKALQDLLDAINPILEDREGSLWIGTGWGLVRRLPDGRMIHVSVRPKRGLDGVASLLESSDGTLWIGQTDGLFVFKPESVRTVERGGAAVPIPLVERASVSSSDAPLPQPGRAGTLAGPM